jgi:glycosyltransferase involved in cell wall biosynthesis
MPTDPLKIAYLTSQYPAVSHTFILREVLGLRASGLDVITTSVRAPDPAHLLGEAERTEAAQTFVIQRAARNLARLLAAQGPALTAPGRYFGTLAQAWRMRAPGLKAALWQLFYFLEATVLAAHLRAEGAQALHCHFAGPGASVGVLAARLAGIPFSFTLHGPADLLSPGQWRLGEKAAAARFVACISQFARSQLMLHSDPIHWDRYHIIHCGVVPARYDRPRAPRAPEAPLHLVFVGRLAPVKGLRILMDGFARARAAHPGLKLTVVGDGEDRAWLETAAAPYGADVRLTGYLSQAEVADVLAAADLFVLPSFAEGVPVVLMEAMASRLPVIATQITGVPELVEAGVSGLLVPPGDAEALAEAIGTLAEDPERIAAMGEAGRAKVVAAFDIDAEARRLADLFRATVGS